MLRERSTDRHIDVREKHLLVAFHMCPNLGPNPQPRLCALTGNRTGNLLVHRTTLNQLSHSGWAYVIEFLIQGQGDPGPV